MMAMMICLLLMVSGCTKADSISAEENKKTQNDNITDEISEKTEEISKEEVTGNETNDNGSSNKEVEKLTLQYVCEKYDMDESEFDGVDFDAFVEYYGLTVDNMGATGPRFLLSKYKELKYKVKVPEYNKLAGNVDVFLDEYTEQVELVIVEDIKEVGSEQSCNTIVLDFALEYELLSHKPLANSEFSESNIVKEIDENLKNEIISCFKNNNFSSIKKQNKHDDANSKNGDLYHVIVKLEDGTIYEIDGKEVLQDDESKKALSGFVDDIERLAE